MAQAPGAGTTPAPAGGTPAGGTAPPAAGAPAPAPGAPGAPGASPAPGTPPAAAPSTPAPPPPRCQVETYTSFQPQNLTQLKTVTATGAPVTISGIVSVFDSCTLLITGFTYYFAATNSYWYGSNSTDVNSVKILVSNKPIAQSQSQTANYTLVPGLTFNDFGVLYLYSNDDKQVYAQAVLKTPSSPAQQAPPTDAGGSSPATSAKSDAIKLSTNLNIMTKIIIGVSVVLLSFI